MEWVLNLFSEYLENDFKKRLGVPQTDNRSTMGRIQGTFFPQPPHVC